MTTKKGYFSVVRWVKDPVRDEAKNVGLLFVDPDSGRGQIKLGTLPSIKNSNAIFLRNLLTSFESRFESREDLTPEYLEELHTKLRNSVQVTKPQQTLIYPTLDETVLTLFDTFVGRPKRTTTKKKTRSWIASQIEEAVKSIGVRVSRNKYIADFHFDYALQSTEDKALPVELLSFAIVNADWNNTEKDAQAFIFASRRVAIPSLAVIQPPENGDDKAIASHLRVERWLKDEGVNTFNTAQLLQFNQKVKELVSNQ